MLVEAVAVSTAHQACLLLQGALAGQVLGLSVRGLLQAGHLLQDLVASLGGATNRCGRQSRLIMQCLSKMSLP